MTATTRKFAGFLALLFLASCVTSSGDDGQGVGGPGNDPGNTGNPDDPANAAPVCEQVQPIQVVEGQPPDLLLVVDKSGSMKDPLDDNSQELKWPIMNSALDSIVAQHDDGIRFGLLLYPPGDNCLSGSVNPGISDINSGAISTALGGVVPKGATPTHKTLATALQYYQGTSPNPNGRYVLLATDGLPNCGATSKTPTVEESVAAIKNLTIAGIPTFVLGFGSGVNSNPDTLERMAQEGGTDSFYAANSPAELQAALQDIAATVSRPPCLLVLDETPEDDSRLVVSFDQSEVTRDPARQDGWEYNASSNTIQFYGATCTQLQSGSVGEVHVDYGCGTDNDDGGVIID